MKKVWVPEGFIPSPGQALVLLTIFQDLGVSAPDSYYKQLEKLCPHSPVHIKPSSVRSINFCLLQDVEPKDKLCRSTDCQLRKLNEQRL